MKEPRVNRKQWNRNVLVGMKRPRCKLAVGFGAIELVERSRGGIECESKNG